MCPPPAAACTVTAHAQLLGASLLLYRSSPKGPAAQLAAAAATWRRWPAAWLNVNLPILLMYLPVHVFFTLWALSFAFLPAKLALAGWAAFLAPYYALTHAGAPAHTGAGRHTHALTHACMSAIVCMRTPAAPCPA